MADDKNKRIAEGVVEAVGGKENISTALHCMTRLRLVLKDEGLSDDEAIKAVPGVLGVAHAGGQTQVIIGQNVPKVHTAVVAMGVASGGSVDENLDAAGEKFEWTPANVGNAVLGYLSGSMTQMIPVIMTAGLFKLLSTILAPGMLGLVAADSDIITLLDFLYNAGFYFLPIYLGYSAAAKLGITPMLGAYLGGILIAPAFVALAAEGAPFTVFGIPCATNNYAQTVLPILLSVWVMSYVEKFFKRVMPDTLSTVFTPFCTMLVMTPIALCALAPLGSFLGNGLGAFFTMVGSAGGILTILGGGLLGAFWPAIVSTGMHMPIIMLGIANYMATGVDPFVFVCTNMSNFGAFGAQLATFLRYKNKNEKSLALGYFISNAIGGVGEPFLYGVVFKHPRIWLTQGVGSFFGAAIALALGCCYYAQAPASLLTILSFIGGEGSSNLVHAVIAGVIAFAVSLVVTYLFGFTKDDPELQAE